MNPKQNITFAIFDVRPVNPETGQTDFDFINSLKTTVDLSALAREKKVFATEIAEHSVLPFVKPAPAVSEKSEVLSELEDSLSNDLEPEKEVAAFGGVLVDSPFPIRPRPLIARKARKEEASFELDNLRSFREELSEIVPLLIEGSDSCRGTQRSWGGKELESLLAGPEVSLTDAKTASPPSYLPWGPEIDSLRHPEEQNRILNLSPAAKELDAALEDFKAPQVIPRFEPTFDFEYKDKSSKSVVWFASFLVVFFILTFLGLRIANIKTSIVTNSNQAYLNLNLAKTNLSESNFFEAASSFSLATRNFELLRDNLGKASALFKVLNTLTLGGISDISNLIKAGELISQAGLDLGDALEKIYEVNLISIIQAPHLQASEGQGGQTNILEVLSDFRLDLIQAGRNIGQAGSIISTSDFTIVPEAERQKFEDLKAELPKVNEFIDKAADYSDALMAILGRSSIQRYLVLFQNTSELRPTGGFPGSYALIEFDKGKMAKFFVDDIYNPDGQMKEKIVPPRPLQKITPNWGLRDANWFPDFPASAKKAAEFYYKDTKVLVDGVIAVNVDLIPELLKITGPIEMFDFGVTLDSENFLAEVQEEVEYLKTKGQSKEILVDFAPKLLDRLSSLNREDWMKVFVLLVKATEEKDILAYFVDGRLQKFALENGLAGEIKNVDSDYLMIVHSNIMGSKTDAVIDNSVSLKIEKDQDGNFVHTLEIERKNNGGKLGFYNKKNNDYVRLLLPEDMELISLSGNDNFDISPIVNYKEAGFVFDPDLERYEGSSTDSGKKVFAFWMITEKGETSKVAVKYKTSAYDSIYIQKQPGVKSAFKLIFNENTLFDERLSSDKNIDLK